MRQFKELTDEELRVVAAGLSIGKSVIQAGPMMMAILPGAERGFKLLASYGDKDVKPTDKPRPISIEAIMENMSRLDKVACEILREYSARIGCDAETLEQMDSEFEERFGSAEQK